MASVLEYLTQEILELAGDVAEEQKKKTIQPRHLQIAIRTDDELAKLMANAQISEGGVMPNINSYLFPDKKKTRKGAADGTQEM